MATSFIYDRIETTNVGSRRNFLALGECDSYVGTFNLNTSTGLQSITGLPFQPEMVMIISAKSLGTSADVHVRLGVGAAAGSNQWGGGVFRQHNEVPGFADSVGFWRNNKMIVLPDLVGGAFAIDGEAAFNSFDPGGFTINITDAFTNNWTCAYLALANSPGVAVGTAQSSAGASQSITGLGFQPKAVFIITTSKTSLGNTNNCWIGAGAGDGTNEFAVWSGADFGNIFISTRYDTGKIATMAHDATGAAGAGRGIDAQASLASLDADGFTLNWSPVSAGYYFHWFAYGGNADVDRFLYANSLNVSVPTTIGPKALIGFGNDQSEDGWEPSLFGQSIGLSVCDDQGANEYTASYGDFRRSVGNATATQSELAIGSFGCFKSDTQNADAHMRSRCNVKEMITDVVAELGQIIRYV
jgi:hypothetical protein